MPKKKFIDKKNSTTFVLGHRSQRDPLLTDETAPQHILIPLDQVPDLSKGGISAAAVAAAASASKNVTNVGVAKQKDEERKYGIYFDDDYDYLQHLKDCNEVSTVKWDVVERIYAPNAIPSCEEPDTFSDNNVNVQSVKIKLPSSVFESEHKEEIGFLNKIASVGPRPDLDPDVIAALDEDFDHENPDNELEDNFVGLANQAALDEIPDQNITGEDLEGLFSDDESEAGDAVESEGSESNYDDENDSLGSLNGAQCTFMDEETKSHFTSYSMSSSVVKRNKQLLLVDDRFEKLFESYGDTEIGALDCDEIEGDINPESDLLLKYAQEFEDDRKKEDAMNGKIVQMAITEASSADSESEDSDEEKPKEKWDCQSIISTYSTTKNRPKIIREPSKRNLIKVSGKTGIPLGVLGKGLTKDNLKALNEKYDEEHGKNVARGKSMLSGATSVRNKDETTEERKNRKQLVKEYRKERRLERKANTDAFKEEKKRIEKVRLNNKANVQGLKL